MKRSIVLLFGVLLLVMTCVGPALAALSIGLDTGQPINTSTGAILVDAAAIAATKAHYTRLNFIVPPWSSPTDTTLHNGMTWFQTYDSIVNSLIANGVKVYGLIGSAAVPDGQSYNSSQFTTDYTNNFVSIVGHFKDRMNVFEEFNEPNDWNGGSSAQVTSAYSASQLASIYTAVKINHANDPTWQVTLVSGPLFSFDDTPANDYMQQTYAACSSFYNTYGYYPFDGIGYHLYCAQNTTDQSTIYTKLYNNLSAMWSTITSYEGSSTSKKFWISEFGWLGNNSYSVMTEAAQASNLTYAFGLFNSDSYMAPKIAFADWFQICDFGSGNEWGLFRTTPYTDTNKKTSWTAFYNFANAHPAGTGTISGWVKTTGGTAISGATVYTSTGGYTATTDSSGNYTISSVAPATYSVTAAKIGYDPVTTSSVTVTINNTTTANFNLAVSNDAGTGGDAGGSLANATTISPGSYTGTLDYWADVNDYYKFAVTSGQLITCSMTPPSGSDYDLYLYDASGTQKAISAQYGSGTENLSYTADSTGNWVARVYNYTGTGTYSLTVSVSSNGMNNNTPTGTNLAPSSTTVNADTYYGSGFEGSKAVDGSTSTKWCTTSSAPPHWLALDLGGTRTVNGYIVRFPGGCGELSSYNAKAFEIQSASSLSGPWTDECAVDNSAQANVITKSYITPASLRYIRLYITNSGTDNYTRLYEFEVWGSTCSVPTITAQPQNSTVCAGSSASFSVTATNATSYQWQKGGSNISGATSSTYSIASAATGDAGSYDCVVTNSCGSVTSSAATLTVNTAPSITTQPQSQTKAVGQSVTFSVAATGATSYQWRKNSSNISGATSSSYTISSVATGDAGNYDVVVTNSCGSTTSNTATLTVTNNGSITGHVYTLTGGAISGATVQTTSGGYSTTTDSNGNYTLSNVAPATYSVTASLTGYNSVTNSGVTVTAGNATTSNFNLQNTTNSNTPSGTNRATASTTVNVDSYYGAGCEGSKAVDGSTSTKWCTTSAAPPHWLALDLGTTRTVNGFVIKFPGGCGEYATYNAKNFSIQSATSLSGPWYDEVVVDNTSQANTVARSYTVARSLRYVRLYITNSGIDNYSRVYEVEVWCQ